MCAVSVRRKENSFLDVCELLKFFPASDEPNTIFWLELVILFAVQQLVSQLWKIEDILVN